MSGANGTKARMVWIGVGALALNVCSFGGGYIFSAGRNEQRLAAVEDYIRVHQLWASQRSDVLVQNTQALVQHGGQIEDLAETHRRDIDMIRSEMRAGFQDIREALAQRGAR